MSAPAIATATEGAARIILAHGRTDHGGWCWYRVAKAAAHRVDLAASGIDASMPPGSVVEL
jgi:hypothetical protein